MDKLKHNLPVVICLATMLGCGAHPPISTEVPASSSPVVNSLPDGGEKVVDQTLVVPKKTVSLKGTIKFQGLPPVLPPLVVRGDPLVRDSAVCAATEVPDESLLVNASGNGVANVFVYLSKIPDGYTPPPVPRTPSEIRALGCRFIPHCQIVRTNQVLLHKVLDDAPHNMHAFPTHAREFGMAIAPNDRQGVPLTLSRAEKVPVLVVCDLHIWMKAYIGVQDHPFQAVTDVNGNFEIPDLPEGTHEFVVWHERPGYLERAQPVTIKAGETSRLELSIEARRFEKK